MIQLSLILTFLILKFPQLLSWIEKIGKWKWRASTMLKIKSQELGLIWKKAPQNNKADEVKLNIYRYTSTFVIMRN